MFTKTLCRYAQLFQLPLWVSFAWLMVNAYFYKMMRGIVLFMVAFRVIVMTSPAFAAAKLEVPVQFVVVNGTYKDSYVSVRKDDSTSFKVNGKRSINLRLDYGHDYYLVFIKPGYITKTIHINTETGNDRIITDFKSYKIGVRLFKQYDGVNIVVFNQPVAFINYHPDLDEFQYDVDYTKSILSELKRAEDELEKKAKEERDFSKKFTASAGQYKSEESLPTGKINSSASLPLLKTAASTTSSDTDAGIQAEKDNKGDHLPDKIKLPDADRNIPDGGDSEEKRASNWPANGQDVLQKPAGSGNEEKPSDRLIQDGKSEYNTPNHLHDKGSDTNALTPTGRILLEKLTEVRTEKGRTITNIQIKEGGKVTTYRKVKYDWGGVYFFKNNNIPVSEHIYNEIK